MIWKGIKIDSKKGRLYWATAPGCRTDLLGKEAGGLHPDNKGRLYWAVMVGGKTYRRGRLVFFASKGRWSTPFVDHRNRNGLDDRISNLREATRLQNAWNRTEQKRLSKLPAGVRIQSNGRFQAQIQCKNRKLPLGTFDTASEANAVYRNKRRELYGEFA